MLYIKHNVHKKLNTILVAQDLIRHIRKKIMNYIEIYIPVSKLDRTLIMMWPVIDFFPI